MRTFWSFLLGASISFMQPALAHEGMWLPTVLSSIQDDMQAMGLQLSAEDIYSINNSSLKDAIVLFGGGCTAEVISKHGLILTNHHCGFGAIRSHSSVENDRLKNGFWAASHADELMSPGITATFIIRMEDVTSRVLEGLKADASEMERQAHVDSISAELAKAAEEEGRYEAAVRAFNFGNSYLLVVSEVFPDVRLVGAPPSAVGKFGGDTDNWMWPRHTGDFSLFRIYAGADGRPAQPSAENTPFTPRHSLPIAMDGVAEGDFAMVFGFPGHTQRYLPSSAVQYVMEVQDPLRIRMRRASLEVIDAAMRSSDKRRIQYASRQSGISNGYKKFIGELRGLKELQALEVKQKSETRYTSDARKQGLSTHAEVVADLTRIQEELTPFAEARDLFIELYALGPMVLRHAIDLGDLAEKSEEMDEKSLNDELEKRKANVGGRFKDLDPEVERKIFKALLPLYLEELDPSFRAPALVIIDSRFNGDAAAYVDHVYDNSIISDEGRTRKALEKWNKSTRKKVLQDPAVVLAQSLYSTYRSKVAPEYSRLQNEMEVAMRTYVEGMMRMYPDSTFWPDANSTLRLSYGKVEGSEPRDAVLYEPFTTLSGVVEKHMDGDEEFDVPDGLLELYAKRDFGPYGGPDDIPVCFTSSLHTTGGNSGSPILDGKGRLIGLNFDRSWESTMSDLLFDPDKCRNIAVDIRYVLFIVDKLGGAKHLVEEMELVRTQKEPIPQAQ